MEGNRPEEDCRMLLGCLESKAFVLSHMGGGSWCYPCHDGAGHSLLLAALAPYEFVHEGSDEQDF